MLIYILSVKCNRPIISKITLYSLFTRQKNFNLIIQWSHLMLNVTCTYAKVSTPKHGV